MRNALAQRVAGELALMGFEPDPQVVKLVGYRMADRGELEFKSLRRESPAVASSRSLCCHYMGTGASLTEFLISGLKLDGAVKAEIETLGGIVNTIVSVFDGLLDASQSVPVLFGDKRIAEFSADAEICARQKLVFDLVDLYYRKLCRFSTQTERVRQLLDVAIERLYRAELSTTGAAIRWSAWWRKNALQTVVMGLPAWLGLPDGDGLQFAEHVMWLGRVGEFFGWVDDACDYELDDETGGANWLRQRQDSSLEGCARRIAGKGQRVLRLWDSGNSDSAARDTFRVMVWMWLSGASSKR